MGTANERLNKMAEPHLNEVLTGYNYGNGREKWEFASDPARVKYAQHEHLHKKILENAIKHNPFV